MFKILFIIFIAAITFGGSIRLGIGTPRQYIAIIIFLICTFNLRKMSHFIFNKYIALYFVFIFFWFICSYVNDELEFFVIEFISKYLVAITCYLFTILLYLKTKSLRILMISLLVWGGLNSIVCMLQYINNPVGIALGALFTDLDDPLLITNFNSMGEEGAYLFGLLGNPVLNGHFTMILPFVPVYFFKDENSTLMVKVIMAVLSFLFLIVVFCIQQRSCFIIDLFLFCVLLWFINDSKARRTRVLFYVIFFFVFVGLFFMNNIIEVFSHSRFSSETGDDLRVSIFNDAIKYITNHPLTGGIRTYYDIYGRYPHNIILNALIYSGFIGGTVLLFLYFKQIVYALKLLFSKKLFAITLIFIALSLNGLFHNNSIVTGDAHVWLVWGAVVACGSQFKKKKVNKCIKLQ